MAFIAAGTTVTATAQTTGSWTPTATGNGFSSATGRYFKIGKLVYVVGRWVIPVGNLSSPGSGLGAQSTSQFKITGLPFTALNDSHGDGTPRFPVYHEEHRGFRGRYNASDQSQNFQYFYYTYGNATEIIPGVTNEDADGSLYPKAQTASGSAFPAVIGMYETAS